jgi:uncharacterized membrane protein YphA (DoxX/SURF4 family)
MMKARIGYCVLALLALCAVLIAFAWQEVEQVLKAYRHRADFAAMGREWADDAWTRVPEITTYLIFLVVGGFVVVGLLRQRPWARWVMMGLTICCGWAAATSFGWDSFNYDSDWEMYWILVAVLALLAVSGTKMSEAFRPPWNDDDSVRVELAVWGVALAISAVPVLAIELELNIRGTFDLWHVVRVVAAIPLLVIGAVLIYRGRRSGLWWILASTPILISMLGISRTGTYTYPLLPGAFAPIPLLLSGWAHMRPR